VNVLCFVHILVSELVEQQRNHVKHVWSMFILLSKTNFGAADFKNKVIAVKFCFICTVELGAI
jgi:hypothetical protein